MSLDSGFVVKAKEFFERYFLDVVLKDYVNFHGRASLAEFWYFVVCYFIVGFSALLLVGVISSVLNIFPSFFLTLIFITILNFLPLLLSIALCVPYVCISIRRLHDIGKPGIFCLVSLIPLAGLFILIYFLAQKGDVESNAYGPVQGTMEEDLTESM